MQKNVTRVLLPETVTELVVYAADQQEAFEILNRACDIQEAEQREITLAEALACIREQAAKIEAIG